VLLRTGSAGLYIPGVEVVQTRASVASYAGPFDGITFAALYGMKRFLASYTGSLIRIRRSSDDAELDIGYDAVTGLLDTAAAAAHIGGGSGFVVTWYDQSGNTRNATQATAANQPPYAASAVNSLPSAYFSDAGHYRLTIGNIGAAFSSAASMIAAYNLNDVGGYNTVVFRTKANDSYWRHVGGAGYFGVFRTSRLEAFPAAPPTNGIYTTSVISNATNYRIFYDGTPETPQAAGFNAGDDFEMGGDPGTSKTSRFYMAALALLDGSISAANHNTIGEEMEDLYGNTWNTVS
jgi:hypothetical protein